ncbi:predicted protein, partial [Nematostella vectensis]
MFAEDSEGYYQTELYKRRWIMLFVFCLLSLTNSGQWIMFAAISDVIVPFYHVSAFGVNCLSMVFMAVYILFIVPASWILDRYGLKVNAFIAAGFNVLGAWLKYCGSAENGFNWVVAGQTVTAVAQCFILGVPPRIAAVWFGQNERSVATALGVFASQVGVAIYFATVPLIVPRSPDSSRVSKGLEMLYGGVAILCSLIGAAMLIAFEDAPPVPPSKSQAVLKDKGRCCRITYKESFTRLFSNASYVFLLVAYGIYAGAQYTVATLLNEMATKRFPNQEVLIGLLGFVFVIAGLPATVLAGIWLDRTLAYKQGTIFLMGTSFLSMIAFSITLEFAQSVYGLFLVLAVLGFCSTSFLPLGFEFAAELTYPVPEGTSAGLLNAAAQCFGIFFIVVVGQLVHDAGALAGNLVLSGALLLGVGLLPLVR